MKRLKKTKRPLVLTVNGKAELIVQDVAAYQKLLDIAAEASADEGIRQGIDETNRGLGRPAREVLNEIRAEHGIPR